MGDKLYGVNENLYLALVEGRLTDADHARLLLPWQALHAARIHFRWKNDWAVFRAEPEPWFSHFVESGQAALQSPLFEEDLPPAFAVYPPSSP
jgi:hypothetical protein